ncbi:PAAR domain-containing protein [Paraburkholderia sp. BCC1886]|uniref:PAAR domain-containing protein n=1 Tax=Paraburkholderia sp. BCC1886 TaxID=2562670 RepID=UPI0011840E35|nr:PAAR domain-containing protein [Paraburkholderia sp. BCC1886]
MRFAFIREGDTTSHGGRVLACSPANTVDGKALALLGDKVSCPECGGVYPIVSVKQLGMTFEGRPVASEGDKTACGATLIATQSTAKASPTAGLGGSVRGGKAAVSREKDVEQDGPHRGRFQVLDDTTGQPIPNHSYTITSSTGQTVQGTTDANGYTSWLESHESSSLTFDHPGSMVDA